MPIIKIASQTFSLATHSKSFGKNSIWATRPPDAPHQRPERLCGFTVQAGTATLAPSAWTRQHRMNLTRPPQPGWVARCCAILLVGCLLVSNAASQTNTLSNGLVVTGSSEARSHPTVRPAFHEDVWFLI